MKKPIWQMTETEKVELAVKIILRVAEQPDGMTVAEIEADGVKIHSSIYFALCNQGFLEKFYKGRYTAFKIPDGKNKNVLQESEDEKVIEYIHKIRKELERKQADGKN